jgi:hypothetical protein
VLSLVASGDPVAFSVTLDILEDPDSFTPPGVHESFKRKYDIRGFAAIGLGLIGDPNAVEPLTRMLRDDNPFVKHKCLWALAGIGDLRALKSMVEVTGDDEISGFALEGCMKKITKVSFSYDVSVKRRESSVNQFPELGTYKSGSDLYKKVWQHWYKVVRSWTAQQFEKRYQARKLIPKNTKYKPRLDTLGIPALPFIIEKVKQGDKDLIPLISGLVDHELPKDATQQQCLDWWEKNKQKWLIPFTQPKKHQ